MTSYKLTKEYDGASVESYIECVVCGLEMALQDKAWTFEDRVLMKEILERFKRGHCPEPELPGYFEAIVGTHYIRFSMNDPSTFNVQKILR